MCLAVPGKVAEILPGEGAGSQELLAKVDFQGSSREVSLQMTPDAKVGDWVLVHAGFAMNIINEAEASEIWDCLKLVQETMEAEE